MMMNRKLADGSGGGGRRPEAACVRALDASIALGRKADRIMRDLDEITIPGAVKLPIDENDSLVVALQDAACPANSAEPATASDDTGKNEKMGG